MYGNMRRIVYGEDDSEIGQAVFIPACPSCGRFVKADEEISFLPLYESPSNPNATCKKCGRVEMPFEGFF